MDAGTFVIVVERQGADFPVGFQKGPAYRSKVGKPTQAQWGNAALHC